MNQCKWGFFEGYKTIAICLCGNTYTEDCLDCVRQQQSFRKSIFIVLAH